MQDLGNLDNSVHAYADGETLAVGSVHRENKRISFDSADEARRLADVVEAAATDEKTDLTLNGYELEDVRADGWNGEPSFDIDGTRFTINVEQLREAAELFDEYEEEPDPPEGFYLRAVSDDGDGSYGCEVPLEADYEICVNSTLDYQIHWNEEDNISDLVSWRSDVRQNGAHVSHFEIVER